ncbi:MAG: aspartyl protease family protein [Bacteroidia bacterium]
MKKSLFVLASLLLLLVSSCKVLKTVKVLKKGDITQKNFKEQIPFEKRAGLMVVKVNIEGKDYNFIYDSGASNCVTKELAEILKLKPVVDQTAQDAEGKQGGVQFAMIKEMKIGKISFCNTGAAIIDLQAVTELGCLKVDGLIGANLMRKCFWQLDYVKQQITFSDHFDSLKIASNATSFSFKPLLTGTPIVEVEANGVICTNNIFDTGSSGAVTLSAQSLKKVKAKNPALKTIKGIGSNSSGLYGAGYDTSYVARVNFKIGSFTSNDRAVEFRRSAGNLGSEFFKDYVVTINWKQNKIWFSPQGKEISPWQSFGFSAQKVKNKMLITFLYEGSPAAQYGLKIGDQIIAANGKDLQNISEEDYCEMVVNLAPWKNEKTLRLVFKPDGGTEKIIQLEKTNLLK